MRDRPDALTAYVELQMFTGFGHHSGLPSISTPFTTYPTIPYTHTCSLTRALFFIYPLLLCSPSTEKLILELMYL